jgi:excisionase family DNA binding protein
MGTPTPPHSANEATAKLLTRQEVADRLQISHDTVEKLTASGRLGCHRVLRRVRYSEEHVRAYLEGCEQRPVTVGFRRQR